MADKTKPKRVTLILKWLVGCVISCLVITIVGGVLLLTRSARPATRTTGPVPQPAAPITSQTIDQVRELFRIPQPGSVTDVAWSPDGLMLASANYGTGSVPGSVTLWDAVDGSKIYSFDQVNIYRLAFSPDGKMLAGTGNSSLILWNMADQQVLINMPIGYLGGRSVAFSPDSRKLAYESGTTVNLMEIPSASELKTLQHSSEVKGFVFLPDGQTLITMIVSGEQNEGPYTIYENTFMVWNMESGSVLRTFTLSGSLEEWVVSPDGISLAAGFNSNTLKIWDMHDGRELQSFGNFSFGVPRFGFSPDGSVLGVGEGVGFEVASPCRLRLLDLTSGREAQMLAGHKGVIVRAVFSPGGRLLATASEDKTIRFWGVPPEIKE